MAPITAKRKVSSRVVDAVQRVSLGVPPALAAKEAGLSPSVLRAAIQRAQSLKGLSEGIKEELADQWYVLAQEAMSSITAEDLTGASAKEKTYIAAMATDKARLMEGKPTAILAEYKLIIEKYMVKPDAVVLAPVEPAQDVEFMEQCAV